MKILLLAPQPFFQVRGTPIATRLLMQTLADDGHQIHLLTLHEGEDVQIPNCTLQRIPAPPWVRNVPPGFSWGKLLCDIVMLLVALRLVRRRRWDVVHAVEESVFIAWVIKKLKGIPYVYDMDSSLPEQLCEAFPWLKIVRSPARRWERAMISDSTGVLTVCRALEHLVRSSSPQVTLARVEDVSLLSVGGRLTTDPLSGLDGKIVMYVGNLQRYQGIELLLRAFAQLLALRPDCRLVIVGGSPRDICVYERMAARLRILHRTNFLGPRPINELMFQLKRADVLVSPRVSGINTPMKIFSYLESGTPIVATRQLTHTQVLDDHIACLVDANPDALAQGIDRVLSDPSYGQSLATRAQERSKQEYQADAAQRKLVEFYRRLRGRWGTQPVPSDPGAVPELGRSQLESSERTI